MGVLPRQSAVCRLPSAVFHLSSVTCDLSSVILASVICHPGICQPPHLPFAVCQLSFGMRPNATTPLLFGGLSRHSVTASPGLSHPLPLLAIHSRVIIHAPFWSLPASSNAHAPSSPTHVLADPCFLSVFMVPPFLAAYGVWSANQTLLQTAYTQCSLYRQYLRTSSGLWMHIVGASTGLDYGLWATGNAWAAYGMLRVWASIYHSPYRGDMGSQMADLASWSGEIVQAAEQYIVSGTGGEKGRGERGMEEGGNQRNCTVNAWTNPRQSLSDVRRSLPQLPQRHVDV